MNIAIVGSNGYIAKYLRECLIEQGHSILNIDIKGEMVEPLDLEIPEIFNYNTLSSIDLVVFTAAISGPDKCSEEFELCWKINVEGTRFFIEQAISKGCRILFFSSDAVYGDIPGYIYNEESELEGHTAYGQMKRAIEKCFENESLFKSIRLSYVMSANDKFISYCLECIRSGTTADVFHPFYRNVVSISDVVNVVKWFSEHYNEYKPKSLNVTGGELVSRLRIADELNRIYDNRLNYRVSKPTDLFFKNRPMITQMESLYLEKYEILKNESFTLKIQKELEGVKI